MKRVLKKSLDKLLRASFAQSLLAGIVASYIRFVYGWSKFDYVHKERLTPLASSQKPLIVVFWHNRIAMLPPAWQWPRPFYMLSSRHGISLILTKILSRFGIHSILGSTNRHAVAASMEIVDKLKEGAVVGITPDGPKGPNQQCSLGVIRLAKMAAESLGTVTIVPGAYATSRHKRLRSWDRFILPYPSQKAAFMVGEPVTVSSDASDEEMESLRLKLEKNLNACGDEVDAWVGVRSHSQAKDNV